jgi:hypothetical protein
MGAWGLYQKKGERYSDSVQQQHFLTSRLQDLDLLVLRVEM